MVWRIACSLLLFSLLLGVLVAGVAHAQELEVEGTVVSANDGQSLPGVNVLEVGTENGTSTNGEGTYALAVTGPDVRLAFSFVGFRDTTVAVNGRSTVNVQMRSQAEELESVVVTALGISREQRSLGYATSQVDAEELVEATEANPAELLRGKVPGLVVNTNAGGVASSSNISIRGSSTINPDNQPLYVVDGVPIISSTIGGGAGAVGASAGRYGGFDGGTALSIVSPSNIKSISVLKGAGAAALYGNRARDGVILISTKDGRGSARNESSVQFSSTLTARDPLTGFANYQGQYGQGSLGLAPDDEASAEDTGLSSWGAPFDEVDEAVQFDGVLRPYDDVINRQGFYERGLSQKHALSFNGAYEDVAFRFSGSYLNSDAIVPNSGYEQINTALRGSGTFGDLAVDANVTYQNEATNNRTYLNDPARNPNFLISFLPPNVPKSALQPGFDENGIEQSYAGPFVTNPYFAVNKFDADDNRDRILGGVQLTYALTDWLSVQGRQGLDWSNLRRTTVDPFGTGFKPEGSMEEREYQRWESNTKLLLSGTPSLTDDLSVRVDLGGNLRMNQFELVGLRGQGFNVPGLETISNTGSPQRLYGFSEQEERSLFGSAAFSYRDFAFLTVTGRNDWSSTLPEQNNSFFYPSVSGSFVFSDVLPVPDAMSFGKVRASWAEIGGGTSPYRLDLTYSLIGEHQGAPLGNITQISVPNRNLLPTQTRETELGLEMRFFGDRLGLDFTYYRRNTSNQITSIAAPPTSGYLRRVLNSGTVQNRGVEMLLTATPLERETVRWETGLNFAANRSELLSLAGDFRGDAVSSGGTVGIVQQVGEPVSAIYGIPYVRDDEGRIVHGENGLPLQGEQRVLGKGAPDWSAGLFNTFSYKNLYLNVLLDAKWGGQLFSGTNSRAYDYGLHENTLEGRAACDEARDPETGAYPTDGCFVPGGVIGQFKTDEDGNVVRDEDGNRVVEVLRENDEEVTPQEYYGYIGGLIAEEFMYDANYVNLRQVRIGYRLPDSWMARMPLQNVTLSLVGRNLFYLYDSVPNVNPGANYNSAATPGIEFSSIPQTRTFGFDIRVNF
jgi:TonB-linked SusC/RagA family outer membrane protein